MSGPSFGLTVALARLLNPLVWRSDAHVAAKLHAFALAEQGSMLDMRLAAAGTPSPARAAAYLRHADDEARHAHMFERHARKLAPTRELGPLAADSERLFERLGERDFVAFVHHGEARALAQFETYLAHFGEHGREAEQRLFTAIMSDERRHAAYTHALLLELAGDEVQARAALRRVARWELGRRWLRVGRFTSERIYVLATLLVYLAGAPLGLLIRVARPLRRGFRSP